MSDPSEAKLLQRCLQGDAEAWDTLFDRHYAATARFVFQLGHRFSTEDVEEICQETFLKVIRSLHSFQGQSQFQTWLFRIAANKALDHRERQRAAKRGGGKVPISIDQEHPITGMRLDPPTTSPGPDQALIREENAVLVGEALDRLGGPCQEIIELRYFADLSYEEISKTLNLNPKTVSSRLSKCLRKLEAVLSRLIPGGSKTHTSV